MHGFIKRWGGSLAIRLDPRDTRRLGLKEGMEVEVDVRPAPIDFSDLPTFRDLPDAAKRHDELLHGRD
jgi:antitoxin component of MazEF toxin-antitoxin module